MAGKATYTEADRARVYVALQANNGNIKRTARETGFAETTVRRWKGEFADGNLPDVEVVTEAANDFVERAEQARDEALAIMRTKFADAKVGELNAVVGTLTDKISVIRGEATRRTEHVVALPPPEEIAKTLELAVTRAIEAASGREEVIIDAELVESKPALPAPKGD